MNIIGLDIGTTTLSALVLDGETGKVLKVLNEPNDSFISVEDGFSRVQDGEKIIAKLKDMCARLKKEFGPIAAIGIDGQMHGILYLDKEGKPVSPLFTWQDGRGDLPFEDGTYASVLSRKTGYPMATGFGLTTHYWHVANGCVPGNASCLCTIFDYAAMALTGNKTPLMHVSGAASLGLFDQVNGCWDEKALEAAGMDKTMLPPVTEKACLVGMDEEGVGVACAIGDNQASFIGSVRDMAGSVLVNMGTGGQVSTLCAKAPVSPDVERRPLGEGQGILVGSSLCGGRSYAILEGFMRSCAALAGYEGPALYEAMNQQGLEALQGESALTMDTRFSGTRRQSSLRGSLTGISPDNFTAGNLIGAALMGMAREPYDLYCLMVQSGAEKARALIGSGNGIRKNPALRLAFEKTFGLSMKVPLHQEEAAYGAALFAMASAGICTLAEAQKLILYQETQVL